MSQKFRTVLLDMGYKEDVRCHEWKQVPMKELKKGDKFKLFEPNGTIVTFEGKDIFEAAGNAFETEVDGQMVWTIEIVLEDEA